MSNTIYAVNILTEKAILDTNIENDIKTDYDFELDNFQKHAFNCINKNENVLVTAHTGSGKTLVAEYAIKHTLKQNKKAIYTSPIKTLSNEKYKDLKKKFNNIGILTGDNKINPDGDLIVMTAEILRNALYSKDTDDTNNNKDDIKSSIDIKNLGCVIMDEIHFISEPMRGKVWEETLVLLDKNVQLILLSATVSNAPDFAKWIATIKEKPMNLIPTTHRIVPLKHYIYIGKDDKSDNKDELRMIMDNSNNYMQKEFFLAQHEYEKMLLLKKNPASNNLINNLINYLNKKSMLQAIFFSFSRANCEKYASLVNASLITSEEEFEIKNIFKYMMHKYEEQYQSLKQYQIVKALIHKGIAFHHSGLIPIFKEIIEIIFQKGLIKVLFATETFAVGVNMPTKTVVFTELEKYSGKDHQKRFINTAEYRQMSGRAGRRGKDKFGTCIILPLHRFPDEKQLQNVLTGLVPQLVSRFDIDFQYLLKSIYTGVDFIQNSLFNKEHTMHQKEDIHEIKELKSIVYDHQSVNITFYQEIYKLENTDFQGIKLSKSLNKKLLELKNKVDTTDYQKYVLNETNKKLLIEKQKKLDSRISYVNTICNNIINFLYEIGYLLNNNTIDKITKQDISQKGIMATQINDCNSIVLTEIISNNYFDKLTAEEIISVLSIFIDNDIVTDSDLTLEQIEGTDNIYNCLKNISTKIGNIVQIEKKYCENSEWIISYNYIDIAYNWANNMSFTELQQYYPKVYEGNFVRNMLKINNIANTVKSLAILINKIEILPMLEKIDSLIMKDIVNLNSIYLS